MGEAQRVGRWADSECIVVLRGKVHNSCTIIVLDRAGHRRSRARALPGLKCIGYLHCTQRDMT